MGQAGRWRVGNLGSSGSAGVCGQVRPWPAPEGAASLQEQNTAMYIPLCLAAILLFSLANTAPFVLKELCLCHQKTQLCLTWQKGQNNLESSSGEDPTQGCWSHQSGTQTRSSDIPRDQQPGLAVLQDSDNLEIKLHKPHSLLCWTGAKGTNRLRGAFAAESCSSGKDLFVWMAEFLSEEQHEECCSEMGLC